MHISVDGFVAGTNGEPNFHWDEELKNYSIANIEQVDCIILGRKTAPGFIPYWASVSTDDPDFTFAKKVSDIPKIVFSKTLVNSEWANTKLAKGEIDEEINQLKKQTGKDIIVYGGASFVSSLIKHGLIDEYHLFVNPVALGNGLTIFKSLKNKLNLILVNSKPFSCGTVLHCYEPKRD